MAKPLLALLFLLITIGSTFADDQRVGSYGDPQRWELRGLHSADPERLLQSLRFDFPVSLAAHPQAPLQDLPSVLEKRLLLGLRHIGFRDAHVSARFNRELGTVELTVTEGSRFESGKVIVKGLEGELADNIVTSLTSGTRDLRNATPKFDSDGNVVNWKDAGGKAPQEQNAIWHADEPAPFDEVMREEFQKRIYETLENAGYGTARFEISLVPRGQVADLVILVSELGQLPVLRAIEVDGNLRDSDDEIIRYLGVQVGEPLTKERRIELGRILWESGRFAQQTVQSKSDASGTVLQIKVVETMGAPRLDEPLPPQTAALLKCRKWITSGEGRNRDYVITPTDLTKGWEIIASGKGLLFALYDNAQVDGLPQFGLIFGKQGITWHEVQQHRKLQTVSSAANLKFLAGMAANSGEEREMHRCRLTFGFEFKERRDSDVEPPFQVQTMLDPSYFVAVGGDPDVSTKWEQDVVSLTTKLGVIRLNFRTGEFLGYDGKFFNIQAASNLFQQRQEQLELATRNDPNQFDLERPISSVLAFFQSSSAISKLCDLFEVSEENRQKVSGVQVVLKSLVDRDAFRLLERQLVAHELNMSKKGKPIIPITSQPIQKIIGQIAIPYADDLFERDTWPWSVWREAGFTLAGQSPYTNAEMQQILRAGKMGPIGHCLLVSIFSHTGNELLAAKMAQNGLQTLNRFSFHSDCEQLVSKAWPHVIPIVRTLDSLSDAELDAIATVLSADRDLLQQIRGTLKELSDADKPTALMAGLERLWINQWGPQVETQLRAAIAANPATAKAESDKTTR